MQTHISIFLYVQKKKWPCRVLSTRWWREMMSLCAVQQRYPPTSQLNSLKTAPPSGKGLQVKWSSAIFPSLMKVPTNAALVMRSLHSAGCWWKVKTRISTFHSTVRILTFSAWSLSSTNNLWRIICYTLPYPVCTYIIKQTLMFSHTHTSRGKIIYWEARADLCWGWTVLTRERLGSPPPHLLFLEHHLVDIRGIAAECTWTCSVKVCVCPQMILTWPRSQCRPTRLSSLSMGICFWTVVPTAAFKDGRSWGPQPLITSCPAVERSGGILQTLAAR